MHELGRRDTLDAELLDGWNNLDGVQPDDLAETDEVDATIVVTPENLSKVEGAPLVWFHAKCPVATKDEGRVVTAPPHLPTHLELALIDFLDREDPYSTAHLVPVWFRTWSYPNPLGLKRKLMDMTILVKTAVGLRKQRSHYDLYYLNYSEEVLDSHPFPDSAHTTRDLFEPYIPETERGALRAWVEAKLRALLQAENDPRVVDEWLAGWQPDVQRIATEDECALLVPDAGRRVRRLLDLAYDVIPK